MRQVLYISPFFPPKGGISVKRALTVVRNLHRVGWQPVVLAAPTPEKEHDPSTTALLPDDVPVFRDYSSPTGARIQRLGAWIMEKSRAQKTRGGGPSKSKSTAVGTQFLLPTDRFTVDIPAAVAAGERLIRAHDIELIHVNAGPFSALVTGMRLAKRTGLPWIADMRDPWTLHEGKTALRPPLTRRIDRAIEARTLAAADKVVLNTEDCLAEYRASYAGQIAPERFTYARNAFDSEIYADAVADLPPPARGGPFEFVYFGRFKVMVEPDELLAGYARFVELSGLSPDEVRFVFIGGLRARDRAIVDALGLGAYVDDVGFVPLTEGYRRLQNADALVLAIVPRLCIPGKLYDYLATGRPILAASENTEVDRILDQTGAGVHAPHGDPDAIADRMLCLYEGRQSKPDAAAVARFDAPALVERLAAIYDEVLAAR